MKDVLNIVKSNSKMDLLHSADSEGTLLMEVSNCNCRVLSLMQAITAHHSCVRQLWEEGFSNSPRYMLFS